MDKRILVQEARECVIPCVGVYGGRMVGYECLYNIAVHSFVLNFIELVMFVC